MNMKTKSLKERKKVANPNLQNEGKKDIWIFRKTKNDVETQNETEVASEKTANQLEQILQNLEDDRKKAKTLKKRKKLQESCEKMMTRLIVDWEHERYQ
jgi:hypothetical protein